MLKFIVRRCDSGYTKLYRKSVFIAFLLPYKKKGKTLSAFR